MKLHEMKAVEEALIFHINYLEKVLEQDDAYLESVYKETGEDLWTKHPDVLKAREQRKESGRKLSNAMDALESFRYREW